MVTTAFRVPGSALRVGRWMPWYGVSLLEGQVETGVEHTVATEATKRGKRNAERGTFVAIVTLAAIVRLWGLGSQPIVYFDSGVYLGEGAFLASAAQRAATALVGQGPANPIERMALATEIGVDGHPPDIAKPGHAILLALSMLLFGKTALAGGLVSALAGIGTVAATYAIR